jgi:hypothetical protein
MDASTELLLAVLSLDSYNRGYDQQITVPGTTIGSATLSTISDPDQGGSFFLAGFSAAAYDLSDGTTVISFRGTVNPSLSFDSVEGGSSIVNGWAAATGALTTQATLALKFYEGATGLSPYDYASNVVVTGHSLGGGLAQIVSILSGDTGIGFDWEPGDLAAISLAHNSPSQLNFGAFSGVYVLGEVLQGVRNGLAPAIISSALDQLPPEVQENIATGLGINNLNPNDPAASVDQIAAKIAGLESQVQQTQLQSNAGFPSDPTNLHSMQLLVLLLYAKNAGLTDWKSIGAQLYNVYFNDGQLGQAIGFKQSAGQDDPNGTGLAAPSTQMLSAIAYSTLDSGGLPFGSTGARSLFSDADTLGEIVSGSMLKGFVAGDTVVKALTEILVQQAGDLAKAAVTLSQNEASAGGAFTNESNVLSINLDPKNWTQSFATANQSGNSASTTPVIIGLGDLVSEVLENVDSVILDDSDPTSVWINNYESHGNAALTTRLNEITHVGIGLASGDDNISGADAPKANDGNDGGALLIGNYGKGVITGSDSGNDLIIGGQTITTGTGDDIIITGSGHVQLNLNGGEDSTDVIYAGSSALDTSITYTAQTSIGASAGAGLGASPGADLIIGNADGGDTFDFTNANHAAFTVVWGGTGNDTFDINGPTNTNSSVNVVLLSMSGITASNIENLDMSKLEDYIDKYEGLPSGAPAIVILNPSESDKLEYNGTLVTAPQVTLSQSFVGDDNYAQSDLQSNVLQEQGATSAIPSFFIRTRRSEPKFCFDLYIR